MKKKAPRPIHTVWAEVDLTALRNNLKRILGRISTRDTQVLAVVKADAYGHGMKPVARALADEGVRFFGVANIDEAVELRTVCPTQKILVLGSFHASQISFFQRHRIIPTVSSVEDVKVLSRALRPGTRLFPVHVKIDTGMGRLGVWHEYVDPLFRFLKRNPQISVEGVYTHFSSADRRDSRLTERQIESFQRVVQRIQKLGFKPRYIHAANSMGLLRFKHAHLNLVRPGIILYGIQPDKRLVGIPGLRPVLSLKTRVSFLKNVKKGRGISYGALYVTPQATRIATLPVGYSHGYRVGFSNKAFVAIRGRKYPVVGRVTMDQTLVDVGPGNLIRRWDTVTLIGQAPSAPISAEDLASLIGTIPYEVLCSIHNRIPRIYKGIR